jgi:hypothetical protein
MRRLYGVLIRLHPRRFRDRFGPEMMAIFEQTSGSHWTLIADAFASLFRQWASRPQLAEAPAAGPSLFMSLEPYRMRSSALVHGGLATLALFVTVIFLIDHPGKTPRWLVGMHRAVESLLPISRSSLEGADLSTTVRLPGQTEDLWMEAAIVYFRHALFMKALDIDGDHIISPNERYVAPASLRRLDRNNDGKLDPWECGFFAHSEPAAFVRRHPVLAVIDADHSGELSAGEIRNAAASLQALDRNGDGYLSPDEYLP